MYEFFIEKNLYALSQLFFIKMQKVELLKNQKPINSSSFLKYFYKFLFYKQFFLQSNKTFDFAMVESTSFFSLTIFQ